MNELLKKTLSNNLFQVTMGLITVAIAVVVYFIANTLAPLYEGIRDVNARIDIVEKSQEAIKSNQEAIKTNQLAIVENQANIKNLTVSIERIESKVDRLLLEH
jgi:hypothetical protein